MNNFNINKKSTQSGRSMIEMLGVLAIVGVLSVGGIAGYSKAMEKFKINKLIDQISHMATDVRTLYMQQSGYDGLYEKVLEDAGLLPENVIYENGNANLIFNSAHAGWVRPTYNSDYSKTTGFSISVTVNQNFCMELTSKDWGDANQGFNGIVVGTGVISGSLNTLDVDGEYYGGYFSKKSPMSIAKASEYCSKCSGTPPYGGCGFVVMFK